MQCAIYRVTQRTKWLDDYNPTFTLKHGGVQAYSPFRAHGLL
jgi:hypothetical protein